MALEIVYAAKKIDPQVDVGLMTFLMGLGHKIGINTTVSNRAEAVSRLGQQGPGHKKVSSVTFVSVAERVVYKAGTKGETVETIHMVLVVNGSNRPVGITLDDWRQMFKSTSFGPTNYGSCKGRDEQVSRPLVSRPPAVPVHA